MERKRNPGFAVSFQILSLAPVRGERVGVMGREFRKREQIPVSPNLTG